MEESAPATGALIRRHCGHYMLGSILCDSAYYYLPFGESKKVALLSGAIHTGRGELDFSFFQRLLETTLSTEKESFFAFACGVLSHHLADRTLHPLVVYLTGDYHSPDPVEKKEVRARHRFLESLVDCRVAANLIGTPAESFELSDYLPMGQSETAPFLSLFIASAQEKASKESTAPIVNALYKTLRFEAKLVGLYSKPLFREAILNLNRLLGGRVKEFAALCYPDEKSTSNSQLLKPIDYCDPFSGEKCSDSFEGLVIESAENLAAAVAALHSSLNDSEIAVGKVSSFFHEKEAAKAVPKFTDTDEAARELHDFLGTG